VGGERGQNYKRKKFTRGVTVQLIKRISFGVNSGGEDGPGPEDVIGEKRGVRGKKHRV